MRHGVLVKATQFVREYEGSILMDDRRLFQCKKSEIIHELLELRGIIPVRYSKE